MVKVITEWLQTSLFLGCHFLSHFFVVIFSPPGHEALVQPPALVSKRLTENSHLAKLLWKFKAFDCSSSGCRGFFVTGSEGKLKKQGC